MKNNQLPLKFPRMEFSLSGYLFCLGRRLVTLSRMGHDFSGVIKSTTSEEWLDTVVEHPIPGSTRTRKYVVQRQEIRGYQICENCGKTISVTGFNQRPHPHHRTELDEKLIQQMTNPDFDNGVKTE